MRVAVLGADGRLGTELVTCALREGVEVRALMRNPRRVHRANEQLSVFAGDAETGEGLAACITGCRAIISEIRSPRPVRCMRNVIAATPAGARLVAVSHVGVGDSAEQGRRDSSLLARISRRIHARLFEQMNEAEELLRKSGLRYLLLRTTRLTDGPGGEHVVAVPADDSPPDRISRIDLARYIIDEISKTLAERVERSIGTAQG